MHGVRKWKALSQKAHECFSERVYGDKNFVSYFRQATPEVELGYLNIGSRPARRKAGGGIETLRAIPWIFSWTQTRFLLPSWLGVGPALRWGIDQGWDDEMREMYEGWPFFPVLYQSCRDGSGKIGRRYCVAISLQARRARAERSRRRLFRELALVRRLVLRISGQEDFLREQSRSAKIHSGAQSVYRSAQSFTGRDPGAAQERWAEPRASRYFSSHG